MRNKVLILCAIICHSALSLLAQNKNDRFHLYEPAKPLQLNVYGGPMIVFSDVEGHFAVDLGATGGIILNQKFFGGLYLQKLITRPPRTDLAVIGYPTYTGGEIKMIHAGILLGYIHKPEKAIHWGISCSGGLGELYLYAKNPGAPNPEKIYNDRVSIVIPRFFVEKNLKKWLKINAVAGYRLVGKVSGYYANDVGVEIPTFYKSDYSKPELSISLIFVSFHSKPGKLGDIN